MNDVEFIIKLKIKGTTVELTPEELSALRDKIDTILGKDKHTYIPYTPVIPEPKPWGTPWVNPSTNPSPIVTWSCNARTKD